MNKFLFYFVIVSLFFNTSYSADDACLEKKTISSGTGNAVQANDEIEISYTLWINDKRIETKKNLRLKLDNKKVIRGLYDALIGAKRGDKLSFNVPPEIGYGSRTEGDIPANSILKYEVEIHQ